MLDFFVKDFCQPFFNNEEGFDSLFEIDKDKSLIGSYSLDINRDEDGCSVFYSFKNDEEEGNINGTGESFTEALNEIVEKLEQYYSDKEENISEDHSIEQNEIITEQNELIEELRSAVEKLQEENYRLSEIIDDKNITIDKLNKENERLRIFAKDKLSRIIDEIG